MSKPNSAPSSANQEDDSDVFTPFILKRPKKPLTVNDNLINFSLNTEKQQQAHRAQEESRLHQEDKKEDKDGKESDTNSSGSKRTRVSSSLRKLLNRSRFSREQPTEVAKPILSAKLNLATAGASLATAENTQPVPNESEEASQPEFAQDEDTNNEPENPDPDGTEPVAANVNPDPLAANTAPATPNVAPPMPPRPPRTTNFVGSPGGGGNLPPIPAAVNSANFMPATPNPGLQNQAPNIIERKNNSGPALIAFLAATYFRRRGERRINRKIEKTNNQLQQTRTQLNTEKLSRQASKINQGQSRSLRETVPANQTKSETHPVVSVEHQTDTLPDLKETTILIDHHLETLGKPVKAAEVFAASPLAKEILEREVAQKEIIKQTEQSKQTEKRWQDLQKNEKQPPEPPINESTFDRRHEVKDSSGAQPRTVVPAMPTSPRSSGGPPAMPSSSISAISTQPTHNLSQSDASQPSAAKQQDLYRQSLQAGFALGLSVVVLGIVAFIILK